MNQMLKRASSVCAALVCTASLTISGASLVMAADEVDEAVKEQIVMMAEGLTDTIIPLSEEEIAARMKDWRPPHKEIPDGWLGVYAKLASSASDGAVMKI